MATTAVRRVTPTRLIRWRQTRLGLLFISPWVIGFCVFYLYPFFATLYYSFTTFTGIGNPVFAVICKFSVQKLFRRVCPN